MKDAEIVLGIVVLAVARINKQEREVSEYLRSYQGVLQQAGKTEAVAMIEKILASLHSSGTNSVDQMLAPFLR